MYSCQTAFTHLFIQFSFKLENELQNIYCWFYHQMHVKKVQVLGNFFFSLQSNFFDEYRIEGKDETNNIYLELVPENLTRAMKSAGSAQAVKIKLTKKHTPCLTFEITLVSVARQFLVERKAHFHVANHFLGANLPHNGPENVQKL